MDRKAVIDIGTNSIKFILAEMGKDGAFKAVMDKNNIAKLGEGLKETERPLQSISRSGARRTGCSPAKRRERQRRSQRAKRSFL